MRARPRSARSSLTSRPTVSTPACTQTWAIPAPIVPSPTTPTLRISSGTAGSLLIQYPHGRDRAGAAPSRRRRVGRDRLLEGSALAVLRRGREPGRPGRRRRGPPGGRRRRAGDGRSPPRPPPGGHSCADRRARRRAARGRRAHDLRRGGQADQGGAGRGRARGLHFHVPGPASEIGDVLVEDERVRLISFTGSAEVGWKLRERAARKKVLLELGNATPVIVEGDADVEDAAAKVAANAFSFAGQSCISVQRVYVSRAVYDDFVGRLVPKVEALGVGDPGDDGTDVGPVIDDDARERILAWIEEAREQGASVLTGGSEENGLVHPTVLADVTPEMKVSSLEVFGPLCTVTPYGSLAEAIDLANGTEYGLQAGIFTSNVRTALRAGTELDFGGVTVNEAPTFRADQMPYGGVKASGNTREGPPHSGPE